MGQAPTGKRVELRWMMTVGRFQDGKVIEEWELFDRMDMLTQLGQLSEPE